MDGTGTVIQGDMDKCMIKGGDGERKRMGMRMREREEKEKERRERGFAPPGEIT